jgi:hypothetical protein
MRMKRILIFMLLIVFVPVSALIAEESDSVSIPVWAVDAALKFITNPDDVFNNFHLDNADYTPVHENAHGNIRTNFFSSFLPLSWGNLAVKVKAVSDGSFASWMPQIDLVGSYGRILALDAASSFIENGSDDEGHSEEDSDSSDFVPPTMSDYSAGVILTKAVSKETRLYAGFQYSALTLNFEFPEAVEITEDQTLDELNIEVTDYILITGISNIIREDKRVVAYLGYGFANRKIFSRFAWHYDHLELGFNIYPEGLLVVHPFMGWHWKF